MRAVIVYYSQSGNTRHAAQLLGDRMRDEIDVDLMEIQPDKSKAPSKPSYSAWRQLGFPIKNAEFDLGKYDLVVAGAPVWYGRPAPFVKTFFDKAANAEGKKAAFFITGVSRPSSQSRAIKAFRSTLEKGGLVPIDSSLTLQMKEGKVLLGEQDVEGFVKALLSGLKKRS